MQLVYAFSESALIVRHWFEIDLADASMEHGCRVEVRRLEPQKHRGSESASQRLVVDEPVWRADLFNSVGGEPGAYAVAHYHPEFNGVEPCDRVWDQKLSSDPWQWLEAQLTSWGVGDVTSPVIRADAASLAKSAPHVVATGRQFGPDECTSSADCHRMTVDTTESVRLMVDYLQRPEALDRTYTAPWLDDRS